MIKVLVVEDSRVVRDYLVHALNSAGGLQVIDAVADGEHALASVSKKRPDVILMDLHLPGMDGLEATRQIMATTPIPIVICTASTSYHQVKTAMVALEAGALACLQKPCGYGSPEADKQLAELVTNLKLMSEVKLVRRWTSQAPPVKAFGESSGDEFVVAIGASTGGPPVLAEILSLLTSSFPVPILLAQHIAAGFGAGFCEWLSQRSGLDGHLACGDQKPMPGSFYLAPDRHHLRVDARRLLQIVPADQYPGPKPSVDVLFQSVAEAYGPNAVGVLLSGMGSDGAKGLKSLFDRGALTLAQKEESCVVFGMPAEAIRLGAARHVLDPYEIAEFLKKDIGERIRRRRVSG